MRRLFDPVFLSAIFAGISLADIGTIVSILAALVAILAGAPAALRTLQKVARWIAAIK